MQWSKILLPAMALSVVTSLFTMAIELLFIGAVIVLWLMLCASPYPIAHAVQSAAFDPIAAAWPKVFSLALVEGVLSLFALHVFPMTVVLSSKDLSTVTRLGLQRDIRPRPVSRLTPRS